MSLSSNIKVTLKLVIFNILSVILVQSVDYDELETLGMSCYPKDSCNRDIRLSFRNRTCECDSACNRFNDCCIDAPSNRPRTGGNNRSGVENVECLEYELDWGVYAVSTCPQNYQEPAEIRSKCEDLEDISNPPAATPTTDIIHRITYKNHYCAECNSADPENLRSWDIGIECKNQPSNNTGFEANSTYVEDHLTFMNNSETHVEGWGFYYPENEGDPEREFYPCEFSSRFPGPLSQFVRFCRANLISSCSSSWNRRTIRQKCEAYMAVVYINGKLYRNPHCAICNPDAASTSRVDICTIPAAYVTKREKKSPLSFTLLMDVNMSDGNRVGEVRDTRCPDGQRWDSFAKKCRRLICAIPGYIRRDGRCVKP